MKKTFTINISGSVFHIDDDAYEKLQKYLQLLNRHFGTAAEGQEILQDIETRIAELFIEKTGNKVEVVTDAMVDEVIARMGKPEDFLDPNQVEASGKTHENATYQEVDPKVRRRLYRDGDSRVLGGVCSGMGAYFNIDVVILRIIFVIAFFLTGGAAAPVYLVFWIVVPKAKTTAQRLEMKGKEATVSNIEKTIREEVNEVGENINRYKSSPSTDGNTRRERFGDVVTSIFRVALRVLVLIFGIGLLIAGIASLIAFVTSVAVGHSFLHGGPWSFGWDSNVNITGLLQQFISPGAYTISLIAISILAGIPILLLLFVATKLLFRYKTNNKLIGLGSLGLWLLALIVLIVVGVNQVGNFGKQTSQTETQKLNDPKIKTLYLETTDDLYQSLIEEHISLDRMKIAMVNGKEKMLGHPRFTIEKSSSGEYLLLIKKHARGSSTEDAQKNVEQIEYNFAQKDSTLKFDPYYFLKDNAKWREQEVSMILKVPEGKSIYMNDKMKSIIFDIENVNNVWDGDMVGKFWTMTPDGLKLKETITHTKK